MTGDEVTRSFVVNDRCYWLIAPTQYRGWLSAEEACAKQTGSVALIYSSSDNLAIARKLTR